MPHRPVQAIYDLIGPEETARAKAAAQKKLQRMLIRDVRKQFGLTQATVAKRMGISQSALSQLESQNDMQLGTLRRLAKAMGGDIEVVLRFPGRAVVVSPPKP